MLYRDRRIRSVAELLTALKRQARPKQLIWFRGHAEKDWKLVPSLAREPEHLKAENALIKRFMQNATPHLDVPPREEWEWIFLMQHHRAYTRLLDWTESPLAALYFAVSNKECSQSDAALWCFQVREPKDCFWLVPFRLPLPTCHTGGLLRRGFSMAREAGTPGPGGPYLGSLGRPGSSAGWRLSRSSA